MGCIYSNFKGECTMWDEDCGTTYENSPVGWDKDGYCVVEDDPAPEDNCENYESENRNDEDW